jgi:hypothetical protein
MGRKKTFLEYNWKILLLITLTLAGDLVHLLFRGIPFAFDSSIGVDSIVYYHMSVIGICNLLPSVVIYSLISKNKISTRTLAFGLILYNLVKLGKEICYANGAPVKVHELDWIDLTSYLGIACMVTVVIIAYRRWRQ